MGDISIKAGKNVYAMIQDGGFTCDRITTYVGPAVGPRWLVASGFDLTLIEQGALGRQGPVLLTGSSAGALRFAAWVQPQAAESYRRLMNGYVSMTFDRGTTPQIVRAAMVDLINGYIDEDAIAFALSNSPFRLAITAARARHIAAAETRWIQQAGLFLSFLCNAANRSWIYHFFERVVFYNSPIPPRFCLREDFRGTAVVLNEVNFRHALLASSAIPIVVSGVKNIFGAPTGVYRDGGVLDYHVNQRYGEKVEDVTLLFHHQERILPVWMDRGLKNRQRHPDDLKDVLIVYPSESFIQKLPGRKVPDRGDFTTFVDDPASRIKNWWHAVELSSHLGEEFLELVETKKIRDVATRM